MKLAVVILAVVAAASAQQYNNRKPFAISSPFRPYGSSIPTPYSTYGSSTPSPYRPFVSSTPAPYVKIVPSTIAPAPVRVASKPYNPEGAAAEILKYGNDANPDGSYAYFYETTNGIAAQEQGSPRNLGGNPPVAPVVAQGSFAYTSPEGVPVSISYTADEYGFRPSGDVLPVGPPIPPLILRSLEYINSAPRKA